MRSLYHTVTGPQLIEKETPANMFTCDHGGHRGSSFYKYYISI